MATPNLQGIVCPKGLSLSEEMGILNFLSSGYKPEPAERCGKHLVPRWRGIKGVEWHAWEFRQAFLLFAVMNK